MDKNKEDGDDEKLLVHLMSIKEEDGDTEKLNAISKEIGNKTGRVMLNLLIDNKRGLYKGAIAKEMPVTYSVTTYHVDNADDAGVTVNIERKIHKKGIKHTHKTIPISILMVPFGIAKEELMKPGAFKKLIKNGIRFASIGIVSASVFMITDLHRVYNPDNNYSAFDFPAYVAPLSVILIGLIIERILSRKKEKFKLISKLICKFVNY